MPQLLLTICVTEMTMGSLGYHVCKCMNDIFATYLWYTICKHTKTKMCHHCVKILLTSKISVQFIPFWLLNLAHSDDCLLKYQKFDRVGEECFGLLEDPLTSSLSGCTSEDWKGSKGVLVFYGMKWMVCSIFPSLGYTLHVFWRIEICI